MLDISGYDELSNKRFKIKLYKNYLSDCYLSFKSYVKA